MGDGLRKMHRAAHDTRNRSGWLAFNVDGHVSIIVSCSVASTGAQARARWTFSIVD
jgi:hypothetical protein